MTSGHGEKGGSGFSAGIESIGSGRCAACLVSVSDAAALHYDVVHAHAIARCRTHSVRALAVDEGPEGFSEVAVKFGVD